MREMEFLVTTFVDGEDDREVGVSVDVTDDEYKSLKNCCREDQLIDGYEGLDNLCEKIKKAAQNKSSSMDLSSNTEIDNDSVEYFIGMPDEITSEIEENGDNVEWDDYCGYPFAMEVVNGEIISMTIDFQEKVKQRILDELRVTDEELIAYLSNLAEDEELCDERFELIGDCEYNAISEILGFNPDEKSFSPEGIGFLDSSYGWEAKDLLDSLGFSLYEDINYGPHGHGTNGVVFVSEE